MIGARQATMWTAKSAPALRLESLQDGSTVYVRIPTYGVSVALEFSTDGGSTWTDVASYASMTLDAGESVLYRATEAGNERLAAYTGNPSYATRIITAGAWAASGDVTALLSRAGGVEELPSRAFTYLFYQSYGLVDASGLVIPSTTMATYCCRSMFEDCTSLVAGPELPATNVADHCYLAMFRGCKALASAPALPATTLFDSCYYQMFDQCASLAVAPDLPAPELAVGCYTAMFCGCPFGSIALPAETLKAGCYRLICNDCPNIARVEVGFTSWSDATEQWLGGNIPSTGTFVCPQGLAEEYGPGRIPEGWTVERA